MRHALISVLAVLASFGCDGSSDPSTPGKGEDDPRCRPTIQGQFDSTYPLPSPTTTTLSTEYAVTTVFDNGTLVSIDGLSCERNTSAIKAGCSSCAQFYVCGGCGVRLSTESKVVGQPVFWKLGSESTACDFFVKGGQERGFFVDWEDDRPGCF